MWRKKGGAPPPLEAAALGVSAKQASGIAMLEQLPAEREVTVEFSDVSCWVPKTFGPPSTLSKLKKLGQLSARQKEAAHTAAKQDMRQVLYGINGSVQPGELLALMGPSGSGKTTLLSMLGGRTPKAARTDGRVTFNGEALSKRVKRMIGFVMQDDLLYEALTVQETLYYAAMLRLPSTMTRAQKRARVDTVIAALGLEQCRDTIHQPSSRLYLMLDTVLLLSQGHAIYYGPALDASSWFASLGHPLPYGTNIADFILDLASGDLAASSPGPGADKGAAQQAHHAAGSSGSDVGSSGADAGEAARQALVRASEAYLAERPQGYEANEEEQADVRARLSLDTSGRSPSLDGSGHRRGSRGRRGSGADPLDLIADEAAAAHLAELAAGGAAKDVDVEKGEGRANGSAVPLHANGGKAGHVPAASLSMRRRAMLTRSATSVAASRPGASRWGASYLMQLEILFRRSAKTRRFETITTQDFVQFLVLGFLCGMIWWKAGDSVTVLGATDTAGLLFFESLFLAFRALFVALFTFPAEFKMMLKERASGMYRLSAFYIARTASDLPMDFAVPSLFIILMYLMGGLRSGGWFFANWSAVVLSTLVAQSFGLLIGATVMQPKTAQTIASVLMLTFMLVGGFYVKSIPGWIGWLKYLSFMLYSYNLLLKIQFGGTTLLWDCGDLQPSDPANTPGCVPVTDVQGALGMSTDLYGPVWEVGALFGFLVFFRVAVYYALRYKTAS